MKQAHLMAENLSTFYPGSHLYRLSEPHAGNEFIVVSIPGPHAPDNSTVVYAANETGAVVPDPSQMRLWVLHRALDRTHAEALSDLGYTLVDDDADTTQ